MPTNRKLIFANGEYYHVFNRGVERRPTFTNKREYSRAVETIDFYKTKNPPVRFSKFLVLDKEKQVEVRKIISSGKKLVKVISYCLMSNHFHFLLQQIHDNGISKFIANVENSYTKYFNLKNNRVGHLFQGPFKAVRVESSEQLLHLSRYIHLNPVSAFLLNKEDLENYQWSSYMEYLRIDNKQITDNSIILDFFSNIQKYKEFVIDYVDYSKKIESIRHLILEDD